MKRVKIQADNIRLIAALSELLVLLEQAPHLPLQVRNRLFHFIQFPAKFAVIKRKPARRALNVITLKPSDGLINFLVTLRALNLNGVGI